jgi:chromosome segregation ATPase
MKSDPGLLLLASLGAALLTAGGAFVRAAFVNGARTGPAPAGDDGDPNERLARTENEIVALREELSLSNSVKEAQRIEMVEQRQRSERQVQGAQAEIQRLSGEVDAERARTKAAQDELQEVKKKTAALEDEGKRPRGPVAAAPAAPAGEDRPITRAAGPDPKVAALEGQLADLQKKLKAVTDEKDAARAKSEALERLVEGVRARSRELAEELKTLKEASPGKVS